MKQVLAFLLLGLVFSFVFVLLFRSPLMSLPVALFFKGTLFLVIACGIVFFLFWYFRRIFNLSLMSLILILIVVASAHLSLFIIFPVTYDRSITMYLLQTIQNKPLITKEKLEQDLINEYIIKNNAIDKRLVEQKQTGFVKVEGQNLSLTNKGKIFMLISKVFKTLFNIN